MSPTRELNSLPLQFTARDMEILHFYTSQTSTQIFGHYMTGVYFWQNEIVTLAFQHPFLLNELFSMAALHLVHMHASSPSLSRKYLDIATLYYVKSISQFRLEIQNINEKNATACYACASLLTLRPWLVPSFEGKGIFFAGNDGSDGEPEIAWYKFFMGAREVQKASVRWAADGPMWSNFKPMIGVPLHTRDHPPPPEDARLHCEKVSKWFQTRDNLSVEDKMILEGILQFLLGFLRVVQTDEGIRRCGINLSWSAEIPDRLSTMIDEKYPEWLVLVAIYAVFLKRQERFWWMKGKAESLLTEITSYLPKGLYDEYLAWPIKEVGLEEQRESPGTGYGIIELS